MNPMSGDSETYHEDSTAIENDYHEMPGEEEVSSRPQEKVTLIHKFERVIGSLKIGFKKQWFLIIKVTAFNNFKVSDNALLS